MRVPGGVAIQPGASATITAAPRVAFRPERLIISPASFRLSPAHRLRTWPAVTIGAGLIRLHRALARALRVDLQASHERTVYVDEQDLFEIDRGGWIDAKNPGETIRERRIRYGLEVEYCYDSRDDGREVWYRREAIPLNRRERALEPLGRFARELSNVRRAWQDSQVGLLRIREIAIGDRSSFRQTGTLSYLPGDMFSVTQLWNVSFETCQAGREIRIDIDNGSDHPCHLAMTMVGTLQHADMTTAPWQTVVDAARSGDSAARARVNDEWRKIVAPKKTGGPV
jgi:hypothetical protein